MSLWGLEMVAEGVQCREVLQRRKSAHLLRGWKVIAWLFLYSALEELARRVRYLIQRKGEH